MVEKVYVVTQSAARYNGEVFTRVVKAFRTEMAAAEWVEKAHSGAVGRNDMDRILGVKTGYQWVEMEVNE